MIDVNQITTTLRGMADRALQQYAMMNKANPYILSLAVAESNQRKQLRTAAQARNMAPQPKVADAAIAGIAEAPPVVDAMGNVTGMAAGGLPEDQGIGRLPTPNMQHMADGGIAGYDDEEGMATGGMGGMFNFAQQSEPVVRMSGGGHIPRYQGMPVSAGGDGSVVTSGAMYTEQLALRDKYEKEAIEMSEGKRMEFSPDVKAYAKQLSKAGNASQAEYLAKEQQRSLTGNPLQNKTAPAIPDRFKTPEVASASAPDLILPYGQSKATNVLGNAPPPPAPPPAPAAQRGLGSTPAAGKVISPEEAVKQAGKFVDYGPAEMEIATARDRQAKQGEDLLQTFEASKPQTKAFEGLEKLLDKQEAETGGEKEKAAGIALIMAGLGIAGGSSPNALQNLKEAIPAVKEYGEALKDIKKMGRENMKMRGDIEQARRAEDKDDTKTLLLLKERIAAREDKIDELGIGLLMKVADTNARTAGDIWKTSYEAVNRKEVAGIAATAGANAELNKYVKLGEADPNSALAKGFQMFKQEGAEPKLYGEYIKLSRDPIDGAAFLQKYPTFDIFKAGYSGSAMQFVPPPANAAILKPPKG
jgi:hypothetical protein